MISNRSNRQMLINCTSEIAFVSPWFLNSHLFPFSFSPHLLLSAPYVNYIRKDPGAPCSLTEALEYLQVDVLADLMEKDQQSLNQKQPPKNKPHNVTVVAMEGCHSFVILDWALPLKDDMVSGEWQSAAVHFYYLKLQSASYTTIFSRCNV